MPRPKVNYDLVGVLLELLRAARAGEIADAFVLYRFPSNEYDHIYTNDDVDDMLFQLSTERIRIGLDALKNETPTPRQ
jgi:hypothetical protein